MTDIGTILQRHSGEQTLAMLETVADLYTEIHSGSPEYDYKMYSRPTFIDRTSSQARQAGFELVTATAGNVFAGFSFGYPFPLGKWWANCTPMPHDICDSSKFAVIELDVHSAYRGKGLSKKLLNELLNNRTEEYATLTAIPGSLAHSMYIRWGWYKVGELPNPPAMDAMLLPLRA
jgi:GNAT superfamily N-acetyltransferase